MSYFIDQLTLADRIQILSIILSLVVSTISIVIAVLTLKQNNNLIEETTRPYVTVYLTETRAFSDILEYYVIKNFGETGAIIDKIRITPELPLNDTIKIDPFIKFENCQIAPKQMFSTAVFSTVQDRKNKENNRHFQIKYHTPSKEYETIVDINEHAIDSFVHSVVIPNGDLEKNIYRSIQEYFRKQL